jgi:hypothetical protein
MDRIVLLSVSIFLMAALTRPAYAYLDPGTGSIILQVLIGGIAGALIAVRLYWQRVKTVFSGMSPRLNEKSSNEGPVVDDKE